MSERDSTLEEWRASVAAAIGCKVADIKTVTELLECNPAGACETHGRCWTHSEWIVEPCDPPDACANRGRCWTHSEGVDELRSKREEVR